MTATMISPEIATRQEWEFEPAVPGGIVVGVDGSRESIAALNTAAAIARARRCPLHAVTVIAPCLSYEINPEADAAAQSADRLRMSLKDSELHWIVAAIGPEEDWTHEVIAGRPPCELASVAEERAADLIVVGRKRRGAIDRMLEGETTLQVMRMSTVPVLAVEADLDRPLTAVVATDFSAPSTRAARAALEVLGTSGILYLAYVERPLELVPNGFTFPGEVRFPGDVVVWFRRLVDGLGARPGVVVEPVVLNGAPASAITEFAERVGADLIAAGSHGRGRMGRLLLGSVSTGLVRKANCAVIVAPPGN